MLQDGHLGTFVHFQRAQHEAVLRLLFISTALCTTEGGRSYHSGITVNDQDNLPNSDITPCDRAALVLVDACLQGSFVEYILFLGCNVIIGTICFSAKSCS